MRCQKVTVARRTVALAPGATTGMTVGPQMAKPEPTLIVTLAVWTKGPGGVDLTGPLAGRVHGVGRDRRRRFGVGRVSFTHGTKGRLGEGLVGVELVRA